MTFACAEYIPRPRPTALIRRRSAIRREIWRAQLLVIRCEIFIPYVPRIHIYVKRYSSLGIYQVQYRVYTHTTRKIL